MAWPQMDEDVGDQTYLMSVSDIMTGLLFIFIITLTAVLISFQSARDTAVSQVAELTDAREERQAMLANMATRLRENHGISVKVIPDSGLLRIPNREITFPSGEATLPSSARDKLLTIGQVLADVVPCYSGNPPARCPAGSGGALEAALIEGHTDNVPLSGSPRFQDNLELSTARAAYTYRELTDTYSILQEIVNPEGEPLFSVSGYGAMRPVAPHDSPTAEPRNRRIDVRFLLAAPGRQASTKVLEAVAPPDGSP